MYAINASGAAILSRVDANGQIKWSKWHRKDAARTNTTWEKDLPDMVETQKIWDAARKAERIAESKDTLEIKVGVKLQQLWHQDATYEMEDAYAEKLDERRRRGVRDYSGWSTIKHIQANANSDSDNDDNAPAAERSRSTTPVRSLSPYISSITEPCMRDSGQPASKGQSPYSSATVSLRRT